jgi:LacI family transcriptional regulator
MSLQILARNLGLSNSTVSRALNGYSDVNPDTRQRVFDEASRIGYRPNPVAHRLATGRTRVIGLVTSVQDGVTLDTGLPAILAGMHETLITKGYTAIATGFPLGDAEMQAFSHFARGGFVDAMVLLRTRPQDPRVRLLNEIGLPFVAYGRTLANDHAWIDNDNESAFSLASERLIDFGHRRIALINASREFTFAQHREVGFKNAMARRGVAIDESLIVHGEVSADAGFAAADALLAHSDSPTGFLCVTDSVAIGVMTAARKRGKTIGRDVSIIGYGNSEASRYTSPELTSIEQSSVDVGHRLAEFALRRLRGEDASQLQSLQSVRIVGRESDGPLSQ